MSVIFDGMLVLSLSDRDGIEELNRKLYAVDTARRQQFGAVDVDKGGAGGSKSFCTRVYAAAFNHLTPSDVEACIAATLWRYPSEVLYICNLGDYHMPDYGHDSPNPISARTVAELRS